MLNLRSCMYNYIYIILCTCRIKHYFAALHPQDSHMEQGPSGMEEPVPRLTLALVDSDSTIVYYNVFNGIHPPTNAAVSKT